MQGLNRITTVIRWQNDMLMVFDQYGHQMPEYQGRYSEMRDKITPHLAEEKWERRIWRL